MAAKTGKNRVTNAQLAAWVGVVPSTIQLWRGRKTLQSLSEKHQKAVKKALSGTNFEGKSLISALESAYIAAGRPCSSVTGRDFTDPSRADRHPLRGKGNE